MPFLRRELSMILSLKRITCLAVFAGFIQSGSLHAQVYGAQGYNPYTGTRAGAATGYNPLTGASATRAAAYNPYTGGYRSGTSATTAAGTNVNSKTYRNPYTGNTTKVQGAYNPYTGRYGVHASVRR